MPCLTSVAGGCHCSRHACTDERTHHPSPTNRHAGMSARLLSSRVFHVVSRECLCMERHSVAGATCLLGERARERRHVTGAPRVRVTSWRSWGPTTLGHWMPNNNYVYSIYIGASDKRYKLAKAWNWSRRWRCCHMAQQCQRPQRPGSTTDSPNCKRSLNKLRQRELLTDQNHQRVEPPNRRKLAASKP